MTFRALVSGTAAASAAMLTIRFFPQDMPATILLAVVLVLFVVLAALNVGRVGRLARRNATSTR